SWSTVYAWLHADAPELVGSAKPRCFRCAGTGPPRPSAYAYLLGLYLGDGWLHEGRRGVWTLGIYCDDAWPGLLEAAASAARDVSGRSPCRVPKRGCQEVKTYWKHWPCLFPQHGPGRKHQRLIELDPWQAAVVAQEPGPLLRGLFHSDGWRGHNVAVHRGPDGFVTRYRYPRYEFSNKSDDIRRICTDALDLLGIAWRPTSRYRIAVSRREAVAALDEHVGPKY
ncbi:MAG TPA: hypothetical protein VNU66_10835, partial [Mycobacteriales bacterium]|nr:hypothetical protein [Mycobacteriales bacterium]